MSEYKTTILHATQLKSILNQHRGVKATTLVAADDPELAALKRNYAAQAEYIINTPDKFGGYTKGNTIVFYTDRSLKTVLGRVEPDEVAGELDATKYTPAPPKVITDTKIDATPQPPPPTTSDRGAIEPKLVAQALAGGGDPNAGAGKLAKANAEAEAKMEATLKTAAGMSPADALAHVIKGARGEPEGKEQFLQMPLFGLWEGEKIKITPKRLYFKTSPNNPTPVESLAAELKTFKIDDDYIDDMKRLRAIGNNGNPAYNFGRGWMKASHGELAEEIIAFHDKLEYIGRDLDKSEYFHNILSDLPQPERMKVRDYMRTVIDSFKRYIHSKYVIGDYAPGTKPPTKGVF